MTRSVLKDSTIFSGLTFISRICSIATFILLARTLGLSDFGVASFTVTLVALVTFAADMGLNLWYQKNSIGENLQSPLNKIVEARLLTYVISIIAITLYLILRQNLSTLQFALVILYCTFEAPSNIFDGYYFVQKKSWKVASKQILKTTLLAFTVALSWKVMSLEKYLFFLMMSSAVTTVWYVPWSKLRFNFHLSSALRTLRQSRPFAILVTTSYVYNRGDTFIIEYQLGSSAVGIYSAAYRYLEGLSIFPSAVSQNLFHRIAQDDSRSISSLRKILFFMLGLGICVAGAVYLFSSFLTLTLLGTAYIASRSVLQIFCIVIVLFFINAPLSTYVQASSQLQKFIPFGIANTVMNLVLNILFVPRFGVSAAAMVMAFTELTGLLLNSYFVWHINHQRHK